MNSPSTQEGDSLKDKATDTLHRMQETVQENVIDPVVQAARGGAAKVADCSRRTVASADEWVEEHPYPTAGFAFAAGIALGFVLGKARWN